MQAQKRLLYCGGKRIILFNATLYLVLLMAMPAYCQARIEGNVLTVYGNLTADDIAKLYKFRRKVEVIFVKDGPVEKLFDRKIFFPRLKDIRLVSKTETNEEVLRSLSENYSALDSLTIAQSAALNASALRYLEHFSRLKYLELKCDIENPTLFFNVLGKISGTIEELNLPHKNATSWTLPKMPNMQVFVVGGTIDKPYLDSLEAPKVSGMDLRGECSPDAMEAFQKFKKLKRIVFQTQKLSARSLKLLKSFGIDEVIAHPEDKSTE